jgi:hypothetical protein
MSNFCSEISGIVSAAVISPTIIFWRFESRQQGDVIVKSGQFAFLVNNRFTLDFEQLLTRANRMRSRQGKPEFLARRTGELHRDEA